MRRADGATRKRTLACAAVVGLGLVLSAKRAHADEPTEGEGAVPHGSAGAVVRVPAPAPAPPKIVPPKQTKFVDPVYPEEAKAAGLQAEVILHLDIDPKGSVTKVEVVEPAGHGFDEAASAAAMGLEFEPATRDGVPVAVRIPYRYAFTLKEVEKVVEQAPPTVGNLGGTVLVSGPDVPLAGADVIVTGADGREQRVKVDAQGKWSIVGASPGKYRVRIEAAGFTPLDATEEVVAGQATDVTYRIAPEPAGIEVTVQGERPAREVTRRTLERKELERIPGTSGDALRAIQSLPGVARPPGLAGLLIVRGSAPQDTLVFVDGVGIPILYHFGGLSSVVPTELLDRIDFYPGNFSAKYGQVMGGIVDVGLREPNTQCYGDYLKPTDKTGCYHALADVNLIDTRFLVQGPIGDWKFAAAARRSWVDAWIGPVLKDAGAGATSAPVYDDYQIILDNKPTPTSHLSFRFFGADDGLKLVVQNPLAQDPALVSGNVTFQTGFYRAQALYQADITRNVNLDTMVSFGHQSANIGLGAIQFIIDQVQANARSEMGFRIARGIKLDAGLDFLVAPYQVTGRGPAPPAPGEPDPGPLSTRPLLSLNENGTVFRPAWYTEAELQPTPRTSLVPGLRVDYARDTGHADVAPRFTGRYDLIGGKAEEDRPLEERRLRTTIKGGVGVFYQPPQYQETNAILGTPGLFSNKAVHYSVGFEQELARPVELSVEAYYKNLTYLVSPSNNPSALLTYDNGGSGSVIGMETLIKWKPQGRFFGWLAYTLSRSVRRNEPGQPEYLFQFDQTHNLTVLGSYLLGNGWQLGARFRLISGSLVTPVLGSPELPALYAADASAYTALSGRPFSERLPFFHQLDVRLDKAWQFRTWRFAVYLDIQNIYNHASPEAVSYNFDYSRNTYQTGLPIIPSLGLRGEL